jgi:HrpA-like RNA helicase
VATTGMAKIVLSTNIAESSITIPDVTAVVDFTLCRSLEYNDERQMPALVLMHASKACMKQLAGRAGRLQPGVCLRLLPR